MEEEPNFDIETQDGQIKEITQSWIAQRTRGLPGVDKTMGIKWVIDSPNKKIIVTRPRSWGKRFNLQIIRQFFEFPVQAEAINVSILQLRRRMFLGDNANQIMPQNESCFRLDNPNYKQLKRSDYISYEYTKTKQMLPTKISEHWEQYQHHFGNYIIITLNLQFLLQQIDYFKFALIQKLYHQHIYLKRIRWNQELEAYLSRFPLHCTEGNYQSIIDNFSNYLAALLQMLHLFHKKKIIVLVKQYDKAYNYLFENRIKKNFSGNPAQEVEIAEIISQILGYIEQEPAIFKIICMGTRSIVTRAGFFSNKEDINSMHNPSKETVELLGFSIEEIWEQLILKIFRHETERQRQSCDSILRQIWRMYAGYQLIGQDGKVKVFYSPDLVLDYISQCIKRKSLVPGEQLNRISISKSEQSLYTKILSQSSCTLSTMLFKLIIEFDLHKQNSIKLGEQILHFNVRHMLRKRFSLYNDREIIYLMIGSGFLTMRKGFITIPARQNWIDLKCLVEKIFKQNIRIRQRRQQQQNMINGQGNVGLTDWGVFRPVVEKKMSVYFKDQDIIFQQYLLQIFLYVLQGKGLQPILKRQAFHLAKQLDGYYHLGQGLLTIQSQRMIINDGLEQHALQAIIREKLELSFFEMLAQNWIHALFHDKIHHRVGRRAILVLRCVVGSYGYERSFKTFWKEIRIENKKYQLIYATDLLFGRGKTVKSIEDVGLYCFNQKIVGAEQFIACVVAHFERRIYDQNQCILSQAERLWNIERNTKNPRSVRNIRSIFYTFASIRAFLVLHFFGFRKLRNQKLTVEDFREMPMLAEMIEPTRVLVEEVQAYLDAAQQLIK